MKNMTEISVNIQQPQKRRIVIIDSLRGLAIIYMVFFHFVYDMAFIVQSEWGTAAYRFNSKISIFDTALFILLAGVSSAFSRSNLRRGGRLLAIGIVFTLTTAFVFPGQAIYFGILQLLGMCMVLYGAFEDRLSKISALPMILACAVIFALTYNIQLGFVGIKGWFEIDLPSELTANNFLYPYGILRGGYVSVDYEPLLPWFFLYMGGTYIGGVIADHRESLPNFCYADPLPPVSFIGRHSLIIYILHQPIILAVVLIMQFFMKM